MKREDWRNFRAECCHCGKPVTGVIGDPDIEKVVRCIECIHIYKVEVGSYSCGYWEEGYVTPVDWDDFCSRGVKREE